MGYDPSRIWATFDAVKSDLTDLAAAATAMATGVKTYDAAIGVDRSAASQENVVEVYEQLGKATGVVSSVPFNHATPASFVAHNVNRDNYLALASEMIDDSATDVIDGGLAATRSTTGLAGWWGRRGIPGSPGPTTTPWWPGQPAVMPMPTAPPIRGR